MPKQGGNPSIRRQKISQDFYSINWSKLINERIKFSIPISVIHMKQIKLDFGFKYANPLICIRQLIKILQLKFMMEN